MVTLEFDKNKAVYFIFSSAFLGFFASVAVAVGSHDVSRGAGVGGALFAFIALVQGAIVWKYS